RDGHLGNPIALPDGLEVKVGLQLIAIEPGLVQVHRLQDRRAKRTKAVAGVGGPAPRDNREEEGISPGQDRPRPRMMDAGTAAQIARPMDVVVAAWLDTTEQPGDLRGVVLIVGSNDDGEIVAVRLGVAN